MDRSSRHSGGPSHVWLAIALVLLALAAVLIPASIDRASAQAGSPTFELVSINADGEPVGVFQDNVFFRPAVSGDGESVLFGKDFTEPYRWSRSAGIAESFRNGLTTQNVMSSNGRFVGLQYQDATNLVNAQTGVAEPWPDAESAGLTQLEVRPRGISDDGTVLLSHHIYALDGTLHRPIRLVRHDLVRGTATELHPPGALNQFVEVATRLTADGRFTLLTTQRGSTFRYDALTGEFDVAYRGASLESMSSQNMSQDGRYIAFVADGQVFLRDMNAPLAQAELLTHNGAGEPSNADVESNFGQPLISDDGRFVVFNSDATDLDAATTGRRWRMYVFDRQTSLLHTLVDGQATLDQRSFFGMAMAGDGSAVFLSTMESLLAQDTNGQGDLYRLDLTALPDPVSTPVPPTPTPVPAGQVAGDPGHSVSANDAGQKVLAAVAADGELRVRAYSPFSGWSAWEALGDDHASVDIAIDATGAAQLVGVKQSGALYTRSRSSAGVWSDPFNHGRPTWDVSTSPSIATNGSSIVVAAVKADGLMYTRTFANGSWGSWFKHGVSGWGHVDVAMAPDGTRWLVGSKDDGRLFTRSADGAWSGWTLQGRSTWSPDTPPAIAAKNSGATIIAVKADGRLYTRPVTASGSGSWTKHGLAKWASADLSMGTLDQIWIGGTKTDGRLFTRANLGRWGSWQSHGLATWSPGADPSIAAEGDGAVVLAVKEDGRMFTRELNGGVGPFVLHDDIWAP